MCELINLKLINQLTFSKRVCVCVCPPPPCRELAMLALAVSCLHLFVQSNWTGPPFVLHVSDLLPSALLDKYTEVQKHTPFLFNK